MKNTTQWKIPPPDGAKREAGFIPMLAVALRFQGKPNGAVGQRYIDEIMGHVMRQARKLEYRELCLYVHEDNTRAIRLYRRYGFQVLGTRNDKGNLRMLKLLD